MRKFRVTVSRTYVKYVTIEVLGSTQADAENQAFDTADFGQAVLNSDGTADEVISCTEVKS